MGSAILAESAMRKARETTGAENYFVIFAKNASSLTFTGAIVPRIVFTIRTESLNRSTSANVRAARLLQIARGRS